MEKVNYTMNQMPCSVFAGPVALSRARGLSAGCVHGLSAALILAVVPLAALAQDEAITKNVEPSTVRIVCRIRGGGWGTGSGFVVDGARHVVTNWHVIADAAGNPMVILGPGKKADARVVAGNEQKDLAILELDPRGRQSACQVCPQGIR